MMPFMLSLDQGKIGKYARHKKQQRINREKILPVCLYVRNPLANVEQPYNRQAYTYESGGDGKDVDGDIRFNKIL
jgi:hypothetical protein